MNDPELERLEELLDALQARVERLIQSPASVRAPLVRLASPVIRAFGWQPQIETRALSALTGAESAQRAELTRAVDELEDSVRAIERAQVIYGEVERSQPIWLYRMLRVLRHALAAERRSWNAWDRRRFRHARAVALRKPLAGASIADRAALVAIDPLIRAAEDEVENLGRRRRLLEAARELLLDAGAALDTQTDALAMRRGEVSRAITRIDRYQAAGLKPGVGLVHQLRQAAERRDVRRVHAALSALEELSIAKGDRELGDRVTEALDTLWAGADRFQHDAAADSLARSAVETFDARIHRAVSAGYDRARAALPALRKHADEAEDANPDADADAAEEYLRGDGVPLALRAALAVDGCFDVGGVLSPARVVEEERRLRLVEFPTQHLMLRVAEGPSDLANAVVDDPRTMLLSLASGRLLARRYVAEEVHRRSRVVLRGEVRIYLLDGSRSMLGPRARMRDAILIAELSTLIARRNDPLRHTNPVLYYRYFTKKLGDIQRVDSETTALAAIESALSALRVGGTDIARALLSSFELIAGAQREDADLARAQIVLVTDGEAAVDADAVLAARARLGALPVGVSIIALGQENPALRALAAKQRALGERVFYHYLNDAQLQALMDGTDVGPPIHAPSGHDDVPSAVAEIIDEIEAHTRRRDELVRSGSPDTTRADDHREALAELNLSLARDFSEGERALYEARARDERTLMRQFERWFPAVTAALSVAASESFEAPPADRADLDDVECVLASVTEVVELVSGDALERRADAIDLFERTLFESGVAPWRYAELCRRYPGRLGAALSALRAIAQGTPPEGRHH